MTGLRIPSFTLREEIACDGRHERVLGAPPQVLLAQAGQVADLERDLRNDLRIDKQGHLHHPLVQLRIFPSLEHEPMHAIHGIIVHQTGASGASSTFNSYKQPGANGAHFLIDKNGIIYQTASVYRRCYHVGNSKSRCMAESRCTPVELKQLAGKGPGRGIGRVERRKSWPDRYPGNSDSIGIENVGGYTEDPNTGKLVYENLTQTQNGSLSWLISALAAALGVALHEVFRHPEVSWKNATEAASAQW